MVLAVVAGVACSSGADRTGDETSTVTVLHGSSEWLLSPPNDDEARLLLFLPLVRYEGGSEPLPALAESWEHSSDYRRWTFHLRRDVKWHDGAPVTAHDIKFTVDLWSQPDVLFYAGAASGEITVLDDYTFTATDSDPNVYLMSGWDVYYPKHLLEHLDPKEFAEWEFWKQPVGNGPYRYARSVPKTMMELEANPDYYAGKPKIERVVLKFTSGTPLTELLSGNVDAIAGMSAEEVRRVEADPRFRVYPALHVGWSQIFWNLRHHLFRDQAVRLALTSAINRRELHRMLHFPEGTPLIDGACSVRDFYGDRCGEALPYDLELARRLLDEAGWRDENGDGVRERGSEDFSFTLLVRPGDPARAATYVQDQFRRVGIEMKLQTMDASVIRERLMAGEFQAAINVIASVPVQHKRFLGEDSPLGYANPRVNTLLDSALVLMDPDAFDRLYREVGQILRAELPMTFLYPGVTFYVAHRRLRGLKSPWRVDPLTYMEYLWLEDEQKEP